MQHTILVVDDEIRMTAVLGLALEDMGYTVRTATSGKEALGVLEREDVDLVLSDLRMPDMDGRALLAAIREQRLDLPLVMMTAYSSVRDAVQIIKEGAFDYIGKPIEMEELAATLARALRLYDTIRDNHRLRAELEGRHSFDSLIGNSPAFRPVLQAIAEVCSVTTNVLITGESGTGKEVAARAIHFNSPRRDGPFVAVNCAAIPDGLLESELFGHVKGAFTGAVSNRTGRFAQAEGGTLFLDEIGDMPLLLQVKLLRVLQERTFEPVGSGKSRSVDARIVAATNQDLLQRVREGRFREDLYYRLNVFPISLPPLRERREDIPQLSDHFVAKIAPEMGKRVTGFTPAAYAAIARYDWPGNIRELQNCVERIIIVTRQCLIDVPDLPPYLFDRPERPATGDGITFPIDLNSEIHRFENKLVEAALKETSGVQVKAATLLGITERSLWHRLKKNQMIVS